jgi:hypothetical protein
LSSGSLASCGRFFEIFPHPQRRAVAQRNDAVLLAFTLADRDRGAFQIQIPQREANQLDPPHSCRVQRLEDGAVSQA